MSREPQHAVVFLGAGASSGAGCPLVRGFVDLGQDHLQNADLEREDALALRATLDWYRELQSSLKITEEDIENIESLLSIADLGARIEPNQDKRAALTETAAHLRRFIEIVVSFSGRLPKPDSKLWLGQTHVVHYKTLVRCLAYLGSRVTLITTNYDCLLEYACHCMGLPFSYRASTNGLHILKLHGSINWMKCRNENCSESKVTRVVPLVPSADPLNSDNVTLKAADGTCTKCRGRLIPFIVPPTWNKSIDHSLLNHVWERAVDALRRAETLVVGGYSLPAADAHIRQLLHLGLAEGKLRQALVVVGNDQNASSRWSSMFRESWRNWRLAVRLDSLENVLFAAVVPALVVPEEYGYGHGVLDMLPVRDSFAHIRAVVNKAEAILHEREITDLFDWTGVFTQMRDGQRGEVRHQVFEEAGGLWTPPPEVLPADLELGDAANQNM